MAEPLSVGLDVDERGKRNMEAGADDMLPGEHPEKPSPRLVRLLWVHVEHRGP